MAQTEAASTSQFISGRIVDVQAVAGDPNIVDAVTAANRSYGGMSEDAVAARIQKIEEQWDTPNADLLVKDNDVVTRFSLVAASTCVKATVAENHRGG